MPAHNHVFIAYLAIVRARIVNTRKPREIDTPT